MKIYSIKQFFQTRIFISSISVEEWTERELQMATAALLVEMIHMDDAIKPEELDAVFRLICEKFSLTPEDATSLISLAEEHRKNATDYYQFTSLINKGFNFEQKLKLIECLWEVAFADGELDMYEEHLVRKIADLIHIPHSALIRIKNRVSKG